MHTVRLLHPRFPLYVVPWGDDLYMVGATVLEREDAGPVTVRSALDLLGTAYAVHPAFGEAEIVELNAGVRPSLPLPEVVLISADAGELAHRLADLARIGFDRVYIHHVGKDQQRFVARCADELLPRLREAL